MSDTVACVLLLKWFYIVDMCKEILRKVFSETLLFYFQRNIISIWKKLSDHSALSRTNDPSHQQPKSVKKLGKPSMHNQEEK